MVAAGDYAGLVEDNQDPHYGGTTEIVRVFDLRTGAQDTRLGGEENGCPDYDYDWCSTADGLVLGADGFSAVHTTSPSTTPPTPLTEHILAADSTGVPSSLDTAPAPSTRQLAPADRTRAVRRHADLGARRNPQSAQRTPSAQLR